MSSKHFVRRARLSQNVSHRRALLFSLAIAGAPLSAKAGQVYWNPNFPTGLWSNPYDWIGNNVPGSGDTARLESTTAETVTLNTNQSVYALSIASNYSSGVVTPTNVLNQTAGSLTSEDESVGGNDGGSGWHNQSGGTNTFNSYLIPGQFAGTTGEYDVSGMAEVTNTGTGSNGTGIYVGDAGTGTFNQSGGIVNIGSIMPANLYLGYSAGATGFYKLSGDGYLYVNGNAYVGGNTSGPGGSGSMSITGSASATITGTLKIMNTFGNGVALAGGLLSVGSLDTSQATGDKFFWISGALVITGSAGFTVDGSSNAPLSNSTGVDDGQSLTVSGGSFTIGNSGRGTFLQSGGSVFVGTSATPTNLQVGSSSAGPGSYTLSSSTATLMVYGAEYDGLQSGTGYFNQSAGSNIATTTFGVGQSTGPSQYLLSGGTLTIGTTLSGQIGAYIGDFGYGFFNQTGGTFQVGNTGSQVALALGSDSNSSGLYQMSGASSVLNISGLLIVGNALVGTFNQAAGTVNTGTGAAVAFASGSTGSYLMNGGILNVSGGVLSVGRAGNGNFSQESGTVNVGTTASNQSLVIGLTSSGIGAYTMNSSSDALTVDGNLDIGGSDVAAGGSGTFNISAGTATISGQAIVWPNSSLLISGGKLAVASLNTSNSAPSKIMWTAGTLELTASSLSVDSAVPFPLGASLAISNGKNLLIDNGSLTVGAGGTGSVVQTGASTVTAGTGLSLGANATGVGSYVLNGSSSVLNVTGPEFIGLNATGTSTGGVVTQYGATFNQATGTHTLTGPLNIGYNSGSTGAFLLSGGTFNTSTGSAFNGGESVGYFGVGLLSQTGGSQTVGTSAVNEPIIIGEASAGSGNYILNGSSATLTVNGYEDVSLNASGATAGGVITQYGGTFNQAAGTHIVTDDLVVAADTGTTGLFQLSGGSLTVGTAHTGNIAAEVVGELGAGVFIQSGGTNTLGTPTANQFLDVSDGSSGSGIYIMNGSGAVLNVDGEVFVGTLGATTGAGLFNLSAGVANVAGTVQLNNTSGSAINVTGGTFNAGAFYIGSAAGLTIAKTGIANTPFVIVQPGSMLTINDSGQLNLLRHGSEQDVSVIALLNINGNGTLDLANNELDLSGNSLSNVQTLVAKGFQNGAWTGTGITSTTAAGDPLHLTAIGVIQNNQGGAAIYTANHQFDGTTPGASDVLVKYTYYGDANLDGKVDASDYSLIDSGFVTHASGWYNGDFNYDGVINGSDYTLIDNAFNRQGVQISAEVADPTASIAAEISAVPEPTAMAIVLLGVGGILGRRRSRI